MAQSTISQRIALEGAEDIQKQLADLGQSGERAIKQIQDATGGAGPALTSLSGIAATVRGAFSQIEQTVAPVRARLSEVGEAAAAVGANLERVAGIFGVGLAGALAGGLAGIAEIIKGFAESSHQLEIQAGVLGLTVEQLQVYRKAAAQVGVDSEQVFTALSRLTQNVGKDHENLNQQALKLLETLPAAASQAGVAIVQGIKPAGDAIKAHIIDNIQQTAPQV
jgi:ABC-type transporter Mla subunit MlaD